MFKYETFRALLGILVTLCVLAGLGYAWLWKVSYTSAQYYEAHFLSNILKSQFSPKSVLVFEDKKCAREDDCIEVSIASYMADPAVQEKAVDYVLNSCNGDRSNQWPCQRNKVGLLRKVNLYFYVEPSKPCVKQVEIFRNPPRSVVAKKSCDVQ